MIDPITQTILEEEQSQAIYWILTEAWLDPEIYKGVTASKFGIKWRVGNLATVDIKKFNGMVDKIAKSKTARAYSAGIRGADASGAMTAGTFKGLATAAVAAAVITIAYQSYKRFFSKAAKHCKGGSGDAKTSCMNRYRAKALKNQISTLQQGLQSCNKTMDSIGCKQKIERKIRKAKVKLGEY